MEVYTSNSYINNSYRIDMIMIAYAHRQLISSLIINLEKSETIAY